ncbi:FAD/NAD(P)-binding domain-containing protein [Dothidotthia symphoricarpi CBS 119687]|uniref:FAD/NAD(P)-binding domain-containing protein n=1 Tax=Dothidotthia symphoricarpi CBS 119687 TaxID=1392245 RepID=A0A6A6A3A1_9PLEO|nr:FAD/NAD(P)-binding domain-containing protein [Dothidotthia symphoricarpi CBS 119687]KAF2125387.1 FAD/NAD(P)-binding domain-containing protein [Dothidotthia symphoricarpi CBS 119687]
MEDSKMESFDLVIVGAGIHGLNMLKTYRDVHPSASILVLDKGSSIGGVWAKDRLYPGLHTNNHFQTFEFSDYPMNTEGFNLANDHIPGEHVNEYLHKYAEKFGLMKHIRFQCSVESAIDCGSSGWVLTVVEDTNPGTREFQLKASKLIVATGLTSEPFVPKLENSETFDAPIYHSSEFARAENGLGSFKEVVLLSGAKFSWDIACAYASAGIKVNWIIRESGHGPCWMMPNRLTPLKIIPELLLQTRLITWLSPCIWEDGFSRIRSFFHQHWLGRKIVDTFFAKMQHSAEEINDYSGHPETAKLKPWDDVFFIGTNRGLLNYRVDFFEFVRNGTIKVHIADITHLSHHTVHLSNGDTLPADVLICGTGWKDTPQLNFVTKKELGLPGQTSGSLQDHILRAESEIFENCPKLKQQPPPRHSKPMSTIKKETIPEPYRLYRFMVPPAFISTKTLAFAGTYRSPATTIIAQAQALWITAFFDDRISSLQATTQDLTERINYETVLHTQFGKWRYSRGFGARFPELWFDCLPYVDLMLKDVGVQNERKKSWWAERFTPYMPPDYAGIVEEYVTLKRI